MNSYSHFSTAHLHVSRFCYWTSNRSRHSPSPQRLSGHENTQAIRDGANFPSTPISSTDKQTLASVAPGTPEAS